MTDAGVVVEHVHASVGLEHLRGQRVDGAGVAVPPAATMPSRTTSADSPSRSATCTFAPSRANSCALDRPMPEPAPVTTTIFPPNSPALIIAAG
jgi:hypothetical protein